jgi:AcrR family transcriptional regulator
MPSSTRQQTEPRRQGRPRSEKARQAVLQSATELLHEVGLRAMTTDQIALRSGVSKATIYKWWPNKHAVATDAFLSEMSAEATVPDTGSAEQDFRLSLRATMRFYASPGGRVLAQLVAEAQHDPVVATEFRDRLVLARREAIRVIWERGVARGELRPDVDVEVAIDLIFGPALYRLLASPAPLSDPAADAIVDAVLHGVALGKPGTPSGALGGPGTPSGSAAAGSATRGTAALAPVAPRAG